MVRSCRGAQKRKQVSWERIGLHRISRSAQPNLLECVDHKVMLPLSTSWPWRWRRRRLLRRRRRQLPRWLIGAFVLFVFGDDVRQLLLRFADVAEGPLPLVPLVLYAVVFIFFLVLDVLFIDEDLTPRLANA